MAVSMSRRHEILGLRYIPEQPAGELNRNKDRWNKRRCACGMAMQCGAAERAARSTAGGARPHIYALRRRAGAQGLVNRIRAPTSCVLCGSLTPVRRASVTVKRKPVCCKCNLSGVRASRDFSTDHRRRTMDDPSFVLSSSVPRRPVRVRSPRDVLGPYLLSRRETPLMSM